jgi:hypothetical protein
MPITWTNEADAILVELWNAGASPKAIEEGLKRAGYAVNRNMIAGRRWRLRDKVPMAKRAPSTPPKARARSKVKMDEVKMKAVKTVSEKVKRRPVVAVDLTKHEGVDYLDLPADGCKALLNKRSGPWNLWRCCGLPQGPDLEDRQSSYCPQHFRLYTHPVTSRTRSHG